MASSPFLSSVVRCMRGLENEDQKIRWVLQGLPDAEVEGRTDSQGYTPGFVQSEIFPFSRVDEALWFEVVIDVDSLIAVTNTLGVSPQESVTIVQYGLFETEYCARTLRVHSAVFPPFGPDCIVMHFAEFPVAHHQQHVFLIVRSVGESENVRRLVYENVLLPSVEATGSAIAFARMAPTYLAAQRRSKNQLGQYQTSTFEIPAPYGAIFAQAAQNKLDAEFHGRWKFVMDCIGFKALVSEPLGSMTMMELRRKVRENELEPVTRSLMVKFRQLTGFTTRWCVDFDASQPGNLVFADFAITALPCKRLSAGKTVLWARSIMDSRFLRWIRDTPRGYANRLVTEDRFANMPNVTGFRGFTLGLL
ncbi:hypothetical protein FVE85_9796 [Porphyridium purpureum]|uniref:Uncharacterized protein n=1 Tax=Porphyridium purpureum TaxID=35688 RepID=A0A5J4YFG7_PORPP|nr:hypothetical protein FVE85_9796 [Porphyridium purpureum]|eukprot:POR9803..scf273_44